jgi:maltose/moltooligosaccharide transporter
LQEVAQPGAPAIERHGRVALSKKQILNLCFGLFGVQIVWGLQNANTSRIFQTLGARVDDLPILWIAGPIAGLMVQPIIGEWSDRTSGRWGRRRPFMTVGAIMTAAALLAMANANSVWAAACALWFLTFSINIVMEPFRALMGDVAADDDRDRGFSMQVLFIGAGAVLASVLPWVLVHWFGIAPNGAQGQMSPAVRTSFAIGAAGLLFTVMWTVVTTRERALTQGEWLLTDDSRMIDRDRRSQILKWGAGWAALGVFIAVANAVLAQRREGYLLAAFVGIFAGLHLLAARSFTNARNPLVAIATEVIRMPRAMRRLAVVEFFTWFALFALWVYAIPAVAHRYYGDPAPGSVAYEGAANWVGILFAGYNAAAALMALVLPGLVGRLGRRRTHALCLAAGAGGLASLVIAPAAGWLWISVIAIGCGWASILAIPYAIVAAVVPPRRMGVYMGIHNVFLVVPQLAAAALLGPLVRTVLHGNVVGVIIVAGGTMLVAAAFALTIPTID